MPIDSIAAGNAVTDVKVNEIIAAINALQTGTFGPVAWFHGTDPTVTLTLPFGTWVLKATSQAYESNGVTMGLYIDGEYLAGHFGNDDGGLNHVTLDAVAQINVTTETYDVDIECTGYHSTFGWLNCIAIRVV